MALDWGIYGRLIGSTLDRVSCGGYCGGSWVCSSMYVYRGLGYTSLYSVSHPRQRWGDAGLVVWAVVCIRELYAQLYVMLNIFQLGMEGGNRQMAPKKVNFFQRLNDARKYAKTEQDRDLYDSLTDVERYVKSGRYCQVSPNDYKDFYEVRLTPQTEAAEALNVSVGSYNFKKGRLSRRLYELFGDDFFSLIYEADGSDKILGRLNDVGDLRKSTDVLLKPFNDAVKKHNVNGTYNLADCETEIQLVTRYSKSFLERALDLVDIDKLGYLINILDGDIKDVEARNTLFDLINGGKVGKVSQVVSLTGSGEISE